MDEQIHVGDNLDVEACLKAVRKLRKKLRQIERLETVGRELTTDEKNKVSSKDDLRGHLLKILNSINRQEESFNSTLGNVEHDESSSEEIPVVYNETEDELQERTDEVQGGNANIDTDPPPKKKPCAVTEPQHTAQEPQQALKLAKVEKKPKLRSKLRKLWRNKTFSITSLEGHNDAVCDISANCGWLVSGSRDTAVKLWDINCKHELRNLSGHRGAVTAVQLLDEEESSRLRKLVTAEAHSELMQDISIKEFPQELLLVTASTDCHIKLWLLPQGICVKSIYSYSPITAMCYRHNLVFAGSESGKLSIYNLVTKDQLCDIIVHNESITSLQCDSSALISTSTDGDLKVWSSRDVDDKVIPFHKVDEEILLKAVFTLSESPYYIEGRQILCSVFLNGNVIFGDDGTNIKVLDATEGKISKIINHKSPGFTDACLTHKDLLFATSFDLDSGCGSVNIRSLNDESQLSYIATLSSDECPRFTCLAFDPSCEETCFFTGGSTLLLWEPVHSNITGESTTLEKDGLTQVKGKNVPELGRVAVDSDAETDSTDNEGGDSGWWWNKPVETGSSQLKPEERQDDSDTDSDESVSSKEANDGKGESSWWCAVL